MRPPSAANGTFFASRDSYLSLVARRATPAEYPPVIYVPLILYVVGAAFLALAVLFLLEARVVRPANLRDGLAADGRRLDRAKRAARPDRARGLSAAQGARST
jgi:hypothetical protein